MIKTINKNQELNFMRKIYLASGSPRRKELLQILVGNNFEITKSTFEEDNNANLPPQELAKIHALGKAKEAEIKEGIVIGSDTFVYFNKRVLGKPKSKEEAKKMLMSLSENYLEVYSGIAAVDFDNNIELSDYVVTKVKFRKLDENEIEKYIQTGEPMDKAGSFAIQGKGSIFIEAIEGDYFSVVGLPLNKLNQMLKELKINIFDYK